ncbi:fimbrillin family protein [Parabacteroides sp. OttesenSCG-928-G07]|nr:fimbrillin family protein [Parabacteroides sp. OttesenSCG-928-G07]
MTKNYVYIILSFFLFGAIACSDENGQITPEGENEEVIVYAGIYSTATAVKTKANTTAFNSNFDLFYRFSGESFTHKLDAAYSTTVTAYNTGLYWDEKGGTGATMTLMGVYPKNESLTVGGLGTYSWTIKNNQNTDNNYEASDLLVSEALAYTLAQQKTSTPLVFHHVLSKITFRLIAGTGFTDEKGEFTDDFLPALVLQNIQPDATVNTLTRGITLGSATAVNVTPKVIDGITVDNKKAKQMTAILIPGQEFAKGSTLAQITMNGNTYDVKLDEKLTLQEGKNHVFNITINKTDVGLKAVITNWDDQDAITSSIKIGVIATDATGEEEALVENSRLFIKVDEQQNDYKYSKTTGWSNESSEIYWDDVNYGQGIYADGLLYNVNTENANNYDPVKTNPEQIYFGKSQKLEGANDTLRFELKKDGSITKTEALKHPFSKINIKVQSHLSNKDRVIIKDIKLISLASSNKFKQVNINPSEDTYMTIDYENKAEYTFSDLSNDLVKSDGTYSSFSMEAYIKPKTKTFSSKEKGDLLMTVRVVTSENVSNDYILRMPKTSDGKDQTLTFLENHQYNITATLTKTTVALSISITQWGDGGSFGGGAVIEE